MGFVNENEKGVTFNVKGVLYHTSSSTGAALGIPHIYLTYQVVPRATTLWRCRNFPSSPEWFRVKTAVRCCPVLRPDVALEPTTSLYVPFAASVVAVVYGTLELVDPPIFTRFAVLVVLLLNHSCTVRPVELVRYEVESIVLDCTFRNRIALSFPRYHG
jgi:hypothetical protein